ncbi:MAG TPA: zinc metallopeptidase [bacterium]|nr:zinc metallopeptidase [bacterium]
MFWDPTFLLMIPGLIITLWAQAKVKSAFNKFSKIGARSGITGAEVARHILNSNGLSGVGIEPVRGHLTDHYDPKEGILRLSDGVYNSQSISALGIAAHEAGHAVQHGVNYSALVVRTAIAPAAATGSKLGIWLFMIGWIIGIFTHAPITWLMDAGIILFSVAVIFTFVTLPVEYDASKRAIMVLEQGGFLTQDELPKAKAVLNAAAWTYVAAAATAVLMLIRLLILRGSRD